MTAQPPTVATAFPAGPLYAEPVTSPDEPEPSPSDIASLARDHLANERTYLAWLRTAVAVMALGLGIAGIANTSTTTSIVAGAILVAAGTIGVCYGTLRYRQMTDDLASGRFRVDRRARSAAITSTVLVVAVFAALVTLLIGRR
jgi:putative membrane protein